MVINTAKAFIRRVFTLSHASFHQENRATIKRILEKNNFPTESTERLLHQVGQMMLNKKSNGNSSYPLISRTELTEASGTTESLVLDWDSTPPRANSTVIDTTLTPARQPPQKTRFAGMTYVPGLSEAVSKQIGKYAPDIKIASRPTNQVKSMFSNMKQKLRPGQCSNLVYNIPCYVGCTCRRLDDRTSEHKTDLKNIGKNNKKTALVHHVFKKGHQFNFDQKEILRQVRSKRTIKIQEANHII
ncbi:hypothetical protein HA402_009350 [Bradysia odoriphaga]|nr:hypothetical protein HA402_009350 [Bradysia odoriphaga]